jgi:hypothetical protein
MVKDRRISAPGLRSNPAIAPSLLNMSVLSSPALGSLAHGDRAADVTRFRGDAVFFAQHRMGVIRQIPQHQEVKVLVIAHALAQNQSRFAKRSFSRRGSAARRLRRMECHARP